MGKRAMRWAVLSASILCSVSQGSSLVLYDGTKSGLPDTQGALAYQNLFGIGTETLAGGTVGPVTLNTSGGALGNNEYAGLSNYNSSGNLVNPAFPALNSSTGFDLTFNAKLSAESHASNDRAGFDVILLGSDLSGIELGFWQGQVWAQATNASNPSSDFTHAESSPTFSSTFDPESGFHSYDLHIQGSGYTLTADGSVVLSGVTRNYSAYPTPPGVPDPYKIPNFVFFGDDTNLASGVTQINTIAVSVPEPASLSLVMVACFGMLGMRHLSAQSKYSRSIKSRSRANEQ